MNIEEMVFVFGSNESGWHGGGAARYAKDYRGAVWGVSYGHTGSSFAIPTKSQEIKHTLTITQIRGYVEGFLAYAKGHPELTFQVTCIGCGLAGLDHRQVAPLFEKAPTNCWFDEKWKPYLGEDRDYWENM